MTEARYLAGNILLAMPGMGDPRFAHAVIAMCVHDENGALGIGIGALHSGVSLHGLLTDVGIEIAVTIVERSDSRKTRITTTSSAQRSATPASTAISLRSSHLMVPFSQPAS